MADNIKVTIEAVLKNQKLKSGLKDTERGFKRAGAAGKKFFSGIKGGFIAGAAALTGLVAVVNKSVKAFAEQQKQEVLLEKAFSKTSDRAKELTEDFKKFASAQQQVTRFGDELTIQAAAQIQQLAGLTGEGLKAATKATQDLASAQGIDLVTAARLVGKTIGSSTDALTRYIGDSGLAGVSSSSERAALLVQKLNEKFGGFAKEEGKTAAGQLAQLSNALGDVSEEVGGVLLPVLTPFLDLVKNAAVGFNSLSNGAKVSLVAIGLLTPAVIALNVAFGPLGLVMAAVAAAGLAIASGLGKAEAKAKRYEKTTEFRTKFKDVKKLIKENEKELEQIDKKLASTNLLVKAFRDEEKLLARRIEVLALLKKGEDDLLVIRKDLSKLLGTTSEKELEDATKALDLEKLKIEAEAGRVQAVIDANKLIVENTKLTEEERFNIVKKGIDDTIALFVESLKFKTEKTEETQAKINELLELSAQLDEARQDRITAKQVSAFQGRLREAKMFVSALGSIGQSIVDIEVQKLNSIDEADTEARDKQKAKVKQAALFNKRVAQATAGIDAAASIVKTMASIAFPFNIPLAIAQGIAGALQIAKIESTPIPGFAKGGRPQRGRPSLVGEEGAELFVPDSAGTVFSNQVLRGLQLSGGGNSSGSIVNNNNQRSQAFAGANFNLNTSDPANFMSQLTELAEDTNSRLFRR